MRADSRFSVTIQLDGVEELPVAAGRVARALVARPPLVLALHYCTGTGTAFYSGTEWKSALSELGLRVVRFRNDEVERELSMVVGKIRELIKK